MSTSSRRRVAKIAYRLASLACALALLPATLVWTTANGLTLAGFALVGLVAMFGLVATARFEKVAIGVFVAELVFASWRVASTRTMPPGWRYCENTKCGTAPWSASLAPESESVLAGLALSRAGGVVTSAEYASYRGLFERAYAHPARGLPNPLLSWSTETTTRMLVRMPAASPVDRAPCIVFLHGFGGLLSAYVDTIASELPGYVVVAPQLDDMGMWGTERAKAVVDATMASLPPEVDPSRVHMIGLSNGSIYGAEYTPRFRSAVLLSGIGDTRGGRVLVIAGLRDARIPYAVVEREAAALRARGVDITVRGLDADHGLILEKPREWGALAREHFARED